MNGLTLNYQDPNAVYKPEIPAAQGMAPKTNGLSFANPYMAPKPKMQNGLAGAALDAFQRGLDPKGRQARLDQNKANDQEKQTKLLALAQQQRSLPEDQRLAWFQANAPAISEITGMDVSTMPVDPAQFTDQALDGHIAMLQGNLGVVAEPMSEYQRAQLAADAEKAGRPTFYNRDKGVYAITPDGQASIVAGTEDEAERPDLPDGMWYGPDGKGEPQPIPGYVDMRTRIARGSQSPSSNKSLRWMTPEEVKVAGLPPGTSAQVNTTTGEAVIKGRPSTAQTGQPTESERSAGLHATISLNGLSTLTRMEAEGYNRAGMSEQIAGAIGPVFGQGEKERLYDQAANEFIDGYLRAMTGAAATPAEIQQYRKQWFAEYGDTPTVLKQKAQGRLNALRGMKSKAGRAWKPEWDQAIADLEGQLGVDQYDAAIEDAIAIGERSQRELDARNAVDPEIEAAIDAALGPDDDGPPEGVSQIEWDNMDEQDRALFR